MTILTSHHGDYLCDFNLLLKAALPFRAIAQMPMIWPDPADRSPLRTNALASTIDITVYILERSGLALITASGVAALCQDPAEAPISVMRF